MRPPPPTTRNKTGINAAKHNNGKTYESIELSLFSKIVCKIRFHLQLFV
jgi:hypothetical protein